MIRMARGKDGGAAPSEDVLALLVTRLDGHPKTAPKFMPDLLTHEYQV